MPLYDVDDEPAAPPDNSEADEELLKEIRENYDYAYEHFEDIRKEREIDMRYICGDPWKPKERQAREDADRPCLNHDELSQYINQSLNNARQNKRGIRVEPAGGNSNDASAEYRQNRIRAIEYKCKADSIYETAYQQMLEGSYGYWRVRRKWASCNENNWEQEIEIANIPNPDSVLYDPDCKEPDWSDARWCFVVEPMTIEQFKKQWPDAQRTDFTWNDREIAKRWFIGDKTILVAEYWKVEIDYQKQKRKDPDTGKTKRRTAEVKTVVQYWTNGVEILERNEQPGTEIPIPACIGLVRYVNDEQHNAKRKIFSLVRLARDPQMMLAFLVSQEAEEAGLTPKTPFIGYTGQFESDSEAWKTVTKKPHPFLQVDPIPDSANGQILPPPQRQNFTPNFQAYEVAKDSARRAIMAAMGISPLPTAAMRATDKSGVAIQRIQQEQALGSYHFLDNWERAIARCGRIIESWLPLADQGIKQVALCDAEDKRKIITINQPMVNPQTGQVEHYPVEEGEHDVTVTVGPSNSSQREAAQEQVAAMIQNLPQFVQIGVIPPPVGQQLLAQSIKLMQLGPIGDQMVETISPQQGGPPVPPQAQQALAQGQTQIQQMTAALQQLQQENQALQMKLSARVTDNQGRLEIEQLKAQAQITTAQINTQNQILGERLDAINEMLKLMHQSAHERGTQAAEHAHAVRMQDEQQQAEIAQSMLNAQNQPAPQQGGM
jgi:hypothetical protein